MIKSLKRAIRMAFAIEKVIKISNAIDDISDGIEEIEQSLGRNKYQRNENRHQHIEKSKIGY